MDLTSWLINPLKTFWQQQKLFLWNDFALSGERETIPLRGMDVYFAFLYIVFCVDGDLAIEPIAHPRSTTKPPMKVFEVNSELDRNRKN
jgi:hypothetical protein